MQNYIKLQAELQLAEDISNTPSWKPVGNWTFWLQFPMLKWWKLVTCRIYKANGRLYPNDKGKAI